MGEGLSWFSNVFGLRDEGEGGAGGEMFGSVSCACAESRQNKYGANSVKVSKLFPPPKALFRRQHSPNIIINTKKKLCGQCC